MPCYILVTIDIGCGAQGDNRHAAHKLIEQITISHNTKTLSQIVASDWLSQPDYWETVMSFGSDLGT